jgi:hypothetical protein
MPRNALKFLVPLLLLAGLLQADFFMRIPRSAEALLRELGGSRIYESEVAVNGGEGRLSSFVFTETADVVGARLARRLKLPQPGAGSSIMLSVSGRSLARYFILSAPGMQHSSLVTVLEQDAVAAGRSKQGHPPWPSSIPAMNATARFTAVCAHTRTTFLSASSTAGSPAAALGQAVSALSGAGWQTCPPSTPEFAILARGRGQCVVFAHTHAESGEITINILQREGSKH